MKITLEGVDCTGKNTIAKFLSDIFGISYFDTDYNKLNVSEFHRDFISGMLYTEMQMYKSLDNFVKPRYSLTELVYSEIYGRKCDQDILEDGCLINHILILILIEEDKYEEYSKLVLSERGEEELLSWEQIDNLQKYYLKYFNASKINNKFAVEWNPNLRDLCWSIKDKINGIK